MTSVGFLLDTNTVSYLAKNHLQAARRHLELLDADEKLGISAVTEAELLFGLERRPEARTLRIRVMLMLEKLTVLPWRHEEAVTFSRLRRDLQSLGKTLAPLDLLIAAHAVTLDAVLVTSDRAFAQLPQLRCEDWSIDA